MECTSSIRSLTRYLILSFFFSSRRRHTRLQGDWSSDVCSSDQRILDRAVRSCTPGPFRSIRAARATRQSVVLIVAHELGLRVGVGLLQNVDGSAQGRPRARLIGRLEAVTAFLAWRRADEHAVEKKGRTRKSSPETCTSEYE